MNGFLELLVYIKENSNLDKVLGAIEQLQKNPMVQMTTEKIIFLSNQVTSVYKPVQTRDEVTNQSLENLSSIAALFDSNKTEVLH